MSIRKKLLKHFIVQQLLAFIAFIYIVFVKITSNIKYENIDSPKKYWQNKKIANEYNEKKYISSLCIKIPNVPGKLGEVSSLIGFHQNNIINMEIITKKTDYLEFIFDIQINDLKNYTNLISELKLKEYKFKVIRHRKKDAFLQRIFKNFKRN